MVEIVAELARHLEPVAAGRRVGRVQIGLVYSLVQLEDGSTGVSYTFHSAPGCRGRSSALWHQPLAGRPARDLLAAVGGPDLLASSLGVACANALAASLPMPGRAWRGDVLQALDLRQGDRVCMVGCFLPLLDALRRRGAVVAAVDELPKPESRPAEEVSRLLPESQVALITATSLINATLAGLLELAASCREVVLLGPSTPLVPEAFAGTHVTWLSGVRVREPEAVAQCIAEGGGFRQFKGFVEKWNVPAAAAPPIPLRESG